MTHKDQKLTPEQIQEKVIAIFSETLTMDAAKITPESNWEDLGMDSLDRIEVTMNLEERFEIEINDDEVEKFKSVKDIINYITEKI